MPLFNLSGYLGIALAAVLALWAFDHQYQSNKYLVLQNDYQQLSISAEIAANEKEYEWKNQYEAATHAAHEREKQLQSDLANLSATNGGLRNTIADLRSQLPTNTAEANRAIADALAIVFGECTERYTAVATEADRRTIESMMLSESWPK